MNSRITELQKSAVQLIFSYFQAASKPNFKYLYIHQTPNIVFNLNIKLSHETINLQSTIVIQEIYYTCNILKVLFLREVHIWDYLSDHMWQLKLSDINLYEIVIQNKLQICNKNADLAICGPSMIKEINQHIPFSKIMIKKKQ